MDLLPGVVAGAELSACGTYRYTLTRDCSPEEPRRHVLWVLLNPSTASHLEDDPTSRKCQKFSRKWGFNSITMANLFALRSKDTKLLVHHPDPVGPANDDYLDALVTTHRTGLVVVAWGADGALFDRGRIVLGRLVDAGVRPMRLGSPTKNGHPGHPLYRPDHSLLEDAV